MDSAPANDDRRPSPPPEPGTRPNGHDLIAFSEWLPETEPTDSESQLPNSRENRSRYWHCRACGQEHDRRSAFDEPCEADFRPAPAMNGGYSIDDDRTRRALSEELTLRFVTSAPGYAVDIEGGERYYVDVEAVTCSCQPDGVRGVYCEHLRRVDLAIRAGELPGPDGRYVR